MQPHVPCLLNFFFFLGFSIRIVVIEIVSILVCFWSM
uniref:Uncharacterized protein n=1 Tax=Rhizophora mucronata TaxID=61149 RepID=A0A2P2QKP3_RHIMU